MQSGILGDDFVEVTVDNSDDFDMFASPHSSRRAKISVSNFQW